MREGGGYGATPSADASQYVITGERETSENLISGWRLFSLF